MFINVPDSVRKRKSLQNRGFSLFLIALKNGIIALSRLECLRLLVVSRRGGVPISITELLLLLTLVVAIINIAKK